MVCQPLTTHPNHTPKPHALTIRPTHNPPLTTAPKGVALSISVFWDLQQSQFPWTPPVSCTFYGGNPVTTSPEPPLPLPPLPSSGNATREVFKWAAPHLGSFHDVAGGRGGTSELLQPGNSGYGVARPFFGGRRLSFWFPFRTKPQGYRQKKGHTQVFFLEFGAPLIPL